MLSNSRTVALLTPEAEVNWLCHPAPTSAALFSPLLGERTPATSRSARSATRCR